MTDREICLAVLDGKPAERIPVMPITMMFAADIIGKPYKEYALNHKILVDAQMATAKQFNFDHVSVISDPAREATDCGAVVEYADDAPPAINESNALLEDKSKIAGLVVPTIAEGTRMYDRVQAIKMFAERTNGEKLIEGWVEGPCAEAADLRGINRLMLDFYDDADFVRQLFEFVVEMGTRFAKEQIDAGADVIGLGDAAASLVGPQIYNDFIFEYEKKLIDAIHEMGGRVRLHICGNITRMLEGMAKLDLKRDFVDIDSLATLAEARAAFGPDVALAGNLDPVRDVMNSDVASIQAKLDECAAVAGAKYIRAAGCEIPRNTLHENVAAFATR